MQAQQSIPIRHRGLFFFGALYPRVTGGMEIFNYYFIQDFLQRHPDRVLYASINEVKGYETKHIPLRILRPMRLFMPLQLLWVLIRYRRKIKFVYTAYSTESWIIPFFSAVLFRLFRIPYIVTIHIGGKPHVSFLAPIRYYFSHAYQVVGVSRQICEDYSIFRERGKIIFIPPLIPFTRATSSRAALRMQYGFEKKDRIVLFAGTLKPMKNPETVLRAMERIGSERLSSLNIKLLIAGHGESYSHLTDWTHTHGLSPYVTFAGLVSREEMANLYALADIYVIASDYEGMPISLLEALYNQLPVIGSNVEGIRDLLTDRETGLLFPVKDENALADRILQLIQDRALADQLARNGSALYNRDFGFDTIIRDYSQMFNTVSNGYTHNESLHVDR